MLGNGKKLIGISWHYFDPQILKHSEITDSTLKILRKGLSFREVQDVKVLQGETPKE